LKKGYAKGGTKARDIEESSGLENEKKKESKKSCVGGGMGHQRK